MLDSFARRRLDGALKRTAGWLDRPWITPDRLTLFGLGLGVGSAAMSAATLWIPAVSLWWVSRLCDGLDGPLARRRRAKAGGESSQAGGFLDISADFVVYGATVAGVGYGAVASQHASWVPFVFVLLAYYINGATFLAFSSIAERTGRQLDDGRSLSFLAGLAEGTETIVVHSLWLLMPAFAAGVASVWAVVVGLSAIQRMVAGYRALL